MKKPKNYYCHRNLPNESTAFINPKFQIVQKIGEGSFGEVFKVFDPESSQLMVLKKMKKGDLPSQEAKILTELTNSQGFNSLKTTSKININEGSEEKLQQARKSEDIIMGCLGPSTGSILKKIKKMNVYSMKKIAFELIGRIKQIHSRFYVHRDIKPDNILLGNKYDCHSIYLIDFGLTTGYKKSSVKARRVFHSLVGTARFCPISSHMGLQQYPKDDLESLGYVLLYMIAGHLPWDKQQNGDEEDQVLFQKIHQKKKTSSIQTLCSSLNCLRKYWKKVKQLKIGQQINYKQLAEYFDVGDPHNQNCFQFCDNCWTRKQILRTQRKSMKQDEEIMVQPRSGAVRNSVIQ